MDIHLALEKLGMIGNYAPDCSTYENMVATWRDTSIAIPSKADLQTAYDNGITANNAMAEIKRLESQITIRRLREAYKDSTWMDAQDELIKKQRDKL
jgi:hypothetical protein|tara:strand:- start:35418 stop:35708 length:291 start_codon:yes stop_codon:yes gene_type:complete